MYKDIKVGLWLIIKLKILTILIEDNCLLEMSLQSTYVSTLISDTSNFVQTILKDLCRISKKSRSFHSFFVLYNAKVCRYARQKKF